jgi:predicted CXXCH cytochrome family protein
MRHGYAGSARKPAGRFFFLILAYVLLAPVCPSVGQVAAIEVMTPPAGAIIMARNPLTHLIIRQSVGQEVLRVKSLSSGTVIDPQLVIEGADGSYLHFRLPLQQGSNSFRFEPSGRDFELRFRKIQADLTLKSLDKNVYLFHQGESLPAACSDCHDLVKTEILEPVGIQKQVGCAVCHATIVDKGTSKHAPTTNLECLSCHRTGREPLEVGFPAAETRELCFYCHPGK